MQSFKQDSNTNQNVLINCEEVTGNYYKSDSIYFTAEDRTEAASLIGMEQNKFLTSTESDKSSNYKYCFNQFHIFVFLIT